MDSDDGGRGRRSIVLWAAPKKLMRPCIGPSKSCSPQMIRFFEFAVKKGTFQTSIIFHT